MSGKTKRGKNLLFLDDGIDIKTTKIEKSNEDDNSENLPTKIVANYKDDFNILYVDDIIIRKLKNEKIYKVKQLKNKLEILNNNIQSSQSIVARITTLNDIDKYKQEMEEILSGAKMEKYKARVGHLLNKYKMFSKNIKVLNFEDVISENEPKEDDNNEKLDIIDEYLIIASEYIDIDIIKNLDNNQPLCVICGETLSNASTTEYGTIICPNKECNVEHNIMVLNKTVRDVTRPTTSENESIDNFWRAFIRYQGAEPNKPDMNIIEKELDNYFRELGRPIGKEIKKLPLNKRGRRGDTTHQMLYYALSQIGRTSLYEHVNYIGHAYFGWTLPNVMHLKESIRDKYIKTEKVYNNIPAEEKDRSSSLGTQYRLFRHLQLEGHECYMDEFKIAENHESISNHHRLWRIMCEGANDPNIYFIECENYDELDVFN